MKKTFAIVFGHKAEIECNVKTLLIHLQGFSKLLDIPRMDEKLSPLRSKKYSGGDLSYGISQNSLASANVAHLASRPNRVLGSRTRQPRRTLNLAPPTSRQTISSRSTSSSSVKLASYSSSSFFSGKFAAL